jgi:hypothetical protein
MEMSEWVKHEADDYEFQFLILVVSVKIPIIKCYMLYVLLLNGIVPTSICLQPSELNDRFSIVEKNFTFLIFLFR